MKLIFRSLMRTDVDWLTELANDPQAAMYSLSIYPRTEHEVEEALKKELEDSESKYVVAECNGEPAGHACLW